MKKNIGIVYISGAGLNKSIWNETQELLDHPSIAIDYGNSRESLKYDDYIDEALKQIDSFDPSKSKKLILVCHSIGGCVGLSLSKALGKRVNGFVAIGATLPKNNSSFVSSLPLPQKLILPLILKLAGTKPPEKSILHEYCNDLSDKQTQEILENFTPESISLYLTKIQYSTLNFPKLYLQLTNDNSMPTALQSKMASNLSNMKISTINSGHLAMVSNPKKVAYEINNYISSTL